MMDPDVLILQRTREKLARMVDAGRVTAQEASSFLGAYADQLTRMSPAQKKQRLLSLDSEDLL